MRCRQPSVSPLVPALVVATVVVACARAEPDLEAERAEIQQVIENSIGWALTKDTTVLFNSLAQDSAFFIYHPNAATTVVGWSEFLRAVPTWMDPAFKATHFEVKNLRINFSRSGSVAWYSALLDDFAEWQGQPVGWEDARWTGVLEKREGRWVIVQMHFSFAIEQIRSEEEEGSQSES
jgi:hypothetical protein